MRRFLISAAIVGLIGGTSLAIAQDRDHNEPQRGAPHDNGPAPHAAPNTAPHGGPAMSGPREHQNAPAMRAAPATPTPASNAMRGNPNPRPNNAARTNNGPRPNSTNATRGPAPNNGSRPNSNNAMRGPAPNNGPRRDFSSVRNFHQNFNAARRFHAPAYRQPQGFYAHHWAWGETLPPAFWVRDYWLTDFYDYDLPPPPPGAVWVRVGSDALLIDQYSGGIIEVDYGVFY